jgi:hypothetical protein
VLRAHELADDLRGDVEGWVREDLVRLARERFPNEIAAVHLDIRTAGEAGPQRTAQRPVDLIRNHGAAAVGERRGDRAGTGTDLVDEVGAP